jgi:hypothetical protein
VTAPTARPVTCPRCGSHSPSSHPAVQAEGEVCLCPHPWHDDVLTASARATVAASESPAEAPPLLPVEFWDAVYTAAKPWAKDTAAIIANAAGGLLGPLIAEQVRLARIDERLRCAAACERLGAPDVASITREPPRREDASGEPS